MAHTRHHKKIISPTDTWLLSHIAGLLKYAKTDHTFAFQLSNLIKSKQWKSEQTKIRLHDSHFLVPTDREEGVITTAWLINYMDQNSIMRTSRGVLTNWAESHELPKDFVIGIVGLAIMSPTLGILKNKKKRRSQLQIIIDNNWKEKHSEMELVSLVQKISQGIMAKELKLAGGNVYNLHPNTAEWCLEEPVTKIFFDKSDELSNVFSVATSEGLSHKAYLEDDNLVAIAISPTVSEEFVNGFTIEST